MCKQPNRTFTKRGKDDHKTVIWWSTLILISAFNVGIWLWTFFTIGEMTSYQQSQLMLSGVYTLVCAYRSILPRIDLERYCLIDTQLSCMVFGRSAATIAEICFSCQFALLLFAFGDKYNQPITSMVAYLVVPSITTAQMLCWYGMLTLNFLGHAIEESIWSVISLVVAGCFMTYPMNNSFESNPEIYKFTVIGAFFSLCYFMFMITVDVPMYITKWKKSKEMNGKRMSFSEGAKDAWKRRVVTSDWEVWRPEVPWLTAYFSTAVWISLSLIHVDV